MPPCLLTGGLVQLEFYLTLFLYETCLPNLLSEHRQLTSVTAMKHFVAVGGRPIRGDRSAIIT